MRRGRLASMVPVALLLLGILEIVAIIAVGRWIGALATIGLLLLGFVLGVWLLKREGRRTWRALRTAASSGKMPSREIADASLVLVGGILLLIPGFITGVIGLFFALPFTRPLTRRVLERFITARVVAVAPVGAFGSGAFGPGASSVFGPGSAGFSTSRPTGPASGTTGRSASEDVIEGEITRETW